MIFMIQLILPQLIRKMIFFIIIILQLIILFEYVWFFVKIELEIDYDYISLFLDYDASKKNSKTIEISILFIIYCYFIQKVNYNTSFYNDQKLDFEVYIMTKLGQLKLLNFLQEIYAWILFILIFFTITCVYYQLLFSIKLFFFSIVFYKFLNLKNLNSIKKYIWILILYCGLNTMLIYFYQFKKLKLLKPFFQQIDNFLGEFICNNMDVIGLEVYECNDLPIKLLPHYFSNFLSILILWEILRICDLIDSQKITIISDSSSISNLNTLNNYNLNENLLASSNENKIKNSFKIIKIIENNKIIPKPDIKKISSKQEDKKDNYRGPGYYKFLLYCLKFAFFFCRIYWLILYANICVIFSAVSFSFSIIVYIFIITFSFLKFFEKIIKRTDKSMSLIKDKLNILKLIRYPIEKRSTNKWINYYRKICFKLILFFALIFIFLTYFYTLIDKIQRYFIIIPN